MKSVGLGALVPAILMAVAGIVWAQPLYVTPMEGNAPGSIAVRAQDDCEDLRRACLDKDAMNERGQGNCKRYRKRCPVAPEHCARLMQSCLRNDASNPKRGRSCRHYRLECGRA
jgi:hypothetical protein